MSGKNVYCIEVFAVIAQEWVCVLSNLSLAEAMARNSDRKVFKCRVVAKLPDGKKLILPSKFDSSANPL